MMTTLSLSGPRYSHETSRVTVINSCYCLFSLLRNLYSVILTPLNSYMIFNSHHHYLKYHSNQRLNYPRESFLQLLLLFLYIIIYIILLILYEEKLLLHFLLPATSLLL